jgi:diguanylate cyclase (GGDEF)-like protein
MGPSGGDNKHSAPSGTAGPGSARITSTQAAELGRSGGAAIGELTPPSLPTVDPEVGRPGGADRRSVAEPTSGAIPRTGTSPQRVNTGSIAIGNGSASDTPAGSETIWWVMALRAVQIVALLISGLALLPLGLPQPTSVLAGCGPAALFATALLFVGAALRERRLSSLAGAWGLLAGAFTLTALIEALVANDRFGWPAAAGLTVGALTQLTAIWLLVRGRTPRWAPSTGWDASVVALGAAAIGAGAFELATRLTRDGVVLSATELTLMLVETVLFVAALTALAIATPTPRPQLRWLAGGLTAVTLADLITLALNGTPALLTPVLDDRPGNTAARLLGLLALAGYALMGLAATDLPTGRRADRRARTGGRSGSLAGVVVLACTGIVAAAVINPMAPRVGAGLALACLGVALARTRRALHEVQQLGRTDSRPRTDDLTGLANRRALSEALAGDRPAGAEADTGWAGWAGWADEIALLMVDLDHFKDVNEGLGHDAGDQLLTEVSARLRTALRPTQLLARLGGDEFAVVLPAAGADQARRVAEALRSSLSEPFEIDGSRLHVQASVGIATCHPSRGEPTDLLRQADVAMYQAKANGSGIELYNPERDDVGPERLRRTDELREALQRGDIVVHIQPQVDLRTGRITGAEALARWRHPEDGVLLPDSFLPLAEHTGLMRPVAAVVLDRALEACASWWSLGHHVPISVNLGADDLRDPDLPGRVSDVLYRYSLPADALRVEIVEQALLTDPKAAAVVLARWRSDGVAVAIDDFGTGYSSLSYLRELPIDEVKLDRAFIADIRRPTTSTIVRHTVAMAHGLWARVVAEGIEDEATARIVTDLGCDVGQGLYFGAAMTTAEFHLRLQGQPR